MLCPCAARLTDEFPNLNLKKMQVPVVRVTHKSSGAPADAVFIKVARTK